MAGLMLILTCFLFGFFWAWTRLRTPVEHVPPGPTPNPNERVEYLEGGIILGIPITHTLETSKKTPVLRQNLIRL